MSSITISTFLSFRKDKIQKRKDLEKILVKICVHNISYLVHSVMLDAGKILRFTHVLLGFIKIQGLLLLSRFSRVRLCATPQTAAHLAPLCLGFSRQEYWSGLPFPSPKIQLISAYWRGVRQAQVIYQKLDLRQGTQLF